MSELIEKLKKDIHYAEGMNSCMNCGVCTAICPAAEFYNYDPRTVVDSVQRNDEETIQSLIRSDLIWYCGECMSCRTRCPRGNTPGLIIMALRKLAQEEGTFVDSEKGRQQYALKRVIDTHILERGYCVTPDLVKPEMHPEQGPVWEWIYEHMDDVFERVHANYRKPGAEHCGKWIRKYGRIAQDFRCHRRYRVPPEDTELFGRESCGKPYGYGGIFFAGLYGK